MESQSTQPGVEAGEGAPPLGFFQRLTGIYFEPSRTFADVDRKPTWLGMYIVICILALASAFAIQSRMDYETYMRKALKMNPMTKSMSEEQVQVILDRPQSAFQKYSSMIFAPIGILIVYFVLAGVFLLLFMMMGAAVKYKKSLAVSYWAMGPPAIIVTILSIVFVYVKSPEDLEINPAANVVSNLGILVPQGESPVLAGILSSIDLFSFWSIFLLAVGFAAVSERKLTVGKAAAGIVVLWALYVLGKAGVTSIFS